MFAGIVVLNVVLNLANIPTMLQLQRVVDPIAGWPALLPALILVQIVVTWVFIAWAARPTARQAPTP